MRRNEGAVDLLEFLGGGLDTLYSRFRRYENEVFYDLGTEGTILHPLHGYSWESVRSLKDRLSMGTRAVIQGIEDIMSLDLLKKYRFDDIELDLKDKISTFNAVEVNKVNTYFREREREKPNETFKIIKAKPFLKNYWKNKSLYKTVDPMIKHYELKFEVLLFVRKFIRKKSKTADISIPFVRRIIYSEELDQAVLEKSWEKFAEGITAGIPLNYIRKQQLFDVGNTDALREKFTKYLGIIGSDETFILKRDFRDSIRELRRVYAHVQSIDVNDTSLPMPDITKEEFKCKPHIEEMGRALGLDELVNNASPHIDLFFLLLELASNKIALSQISMSWGLFKKKNFQWREKMSITHLVRSLRLFIYYEVKSKVPAEKPKKSKSWYYRTPRKGPVTEIPAYRQYINFKALISLEFFDKWDYRDTESGDVIPPFYFTFDYDAWAKRTKNYHPPWGEVIDKHGGSEKEILWELYRAVKPVLVEDMKWHIKSGVIKEEAELDV